MTVCVMQIGLDEIRVFTDKAKARQWVKENILNRPDRRYLKDPEYGPMIECLNDSGNPVSASSLTFQTMTVL